MATLIRPRATVTFGRPDHDGYPTSMGYDRTWRFDRSGTISGDGSGSRMYEWAGRNASIIPQMGCVAPAGVRTPVDMNGSFSIDGGPARFTNVSANPTAVFMEHYDGTVHASTTGAVSSASASLTTCHLSFHRFLYAPPDGQGIHTCSIVSLDCTLGGVDGTIAVAFPIAGDHGGVEVRNVMVYWWADGGTGGLVDVFGSNVRHLLTGPSASSQRQGAEWESWAIEWVVQSDTTGQVGTWIVLTRMGSDDEPYSAMIEGLALPGYTELTQDVTVTCQGAIMYVNVSPIVYGVGSVWSTTHLSLPSGANWNADVEWEFMASAADRSSGYIGVVTDPGCSGTDTFSPMITIGASGSYHRPAVWLVSESHPSIVGGANTDTWNTDDTDDLVSLEWEISSDWRGSRGRVSFLDDDSELHSTGLYRQGWVQIVAGWDGDDLGNYAPTGIGTGWITDIRRSRNSSNPYAASVDVDVEDTASARFDRTCLVDVFQAGGRYLDDWFISIGTRTGVPTGMISVATGMDVIRVPLTPRQPPSQPSHEVRDGDAVVQHLDEVVSSFETSTLHPRWGIDRNGGMFLDWGKPSYEDGVSTIALVIDDTTTQLIDDVEFEVDDGDYRNAVKAAGAGIERYVVSATGTVAADGFVQWESISGDDYTDPDAMARSAYGRYTDSWSIRFKTKMDPTIDPDSFIRIDSLAHLGVPSGSVWQVRRHSMRLDADSNDAVSTIEADWVYTPA